MNNKQRRAYELDEQANYLAAHKEKPDGYIQMRKISEKEKPDGCIKFFWAIPLLIVLAKVISIWIRVG